MTNAIIYDSREAAAAAFREQFPEAAAQLTDDQLVEEGFVDEDCDNEWVINDPSTLNVEPVACAGKTITVMLASGPCEVDLSKLAIDPSNNPGGLKELSAEQGLQVHNTALPKSGLDGKCPHCGTSTRDGSEHRVTEFHELSPGSQNSTTQQFTCNQCAGEWGPVVDKPKRARAPSGSSNGLKIEKDRETRNGVTRPSIGGKCRRVWDMLDELGLDTTAKQARTRAAELGLDKTTCMVQFYRWRKFNGIEGRQ
jgi:hypothetical protein